MPEGPEHHLAARYINDVVDKLIFSGRIVKSDVANNASKHPDISWDENRAYKIHASARGKEVKLTLTEVLPPNKSATAHQRALCAHRLPQMMHILFQFGMSGFFRFVPQCSLPKHAHLRFFTKDDENCHALCFVDARRFGKWRVGQDDGWNSERGPDPIFEYDAFRSNILENVAKSAFNRPICEVLLNQQYFNGIGNYLRCEILYRAKVAPFECARNVLEHLVSNDRKSENPDILKLCSAVSGEVLNLSDVTESRIYDPYNSDNYVVFKKWLQCYGNPDMSKLMDHQGRTVWFSGTPGPLVPKSKKKIKQIQYHRVQNTQKKVNFFDEKVKEVRSSPSARKPRNSKVDPDNIMKRIPQRITRSMTRDDH